MKQRLSLCLLALGILILLPACIQEDEHPPLPTVDRVELDDFMGKWYVLAATPTLFDRNAYNAVEIYERAERGINIIYRFNKDGPDGKRKTFNQKAVIDNPGINTDWTVTVQWPVKFDYKVIYLEPDYSVTVIGHPNRELVWIMARQPEIPDPRYSDIILHLQELGYKIGDIRRIPHS